MSANTSWNVKILRTTEDTIGVSAITSDDAAEEAAKLEGVIKVLEVTHWLDVETDDEGFGCKYEC